MSKYVTRFMRRESVADAGRAAVGNALALWRRVLSHKGPQQTVAPRELRPRTTWPVRSHLRPQDCQVTRTQLSFATSILQSVAGSEVQPDSWVAAKGGLLEWSESGNA